MTVEFEIEGQPFTALNGGPLFKFNEAISLQVVCRTQEEIDYYWEKLAAGGDPNAQACGWLKYKFGVSWQVSPAMLPDLVKDSQSPGSQRAFAAMLKMKKMDIVELEKAYRGCSPSRQRFEAVRLDASERGRSGRPRPSPRPRKRGAG